ncbi:MAG TPA: PAS domain-containing protein, partial [Polyangiaceae bacterium]|nr:PAS domain-containing protein [Polyangiaceae bacterium]
MSLSSPETPGRLREPEAHLEDQLRELRRRCSELELDNRGLKRTLSEVGHARDHFRQAFDEAPVGYCIVDAARRILKLNSSAAGFLGISAEGCVGLPLSDFVSESDVAQLEEHLQVLRQAEQQTRRSVELKLRRQDGTSVQVRLSSIVLNHDAEAWSCLLTVTDLTQLYLLQESDALLRRIAAHV